MSEEPKDAAQGGAWQPAGPCASCNGHGKLPETDCPDCNGVGYLPAQFASPTAARPDPRDGVVEAAQDFAREGTRLTAGRCGPVQEVIEKADKSDPQARLFAALKVACPDDPWGAKRAALNPRRGGEG